ncbi:MAG TPA: hypothetical protein VFV85_07755 [Conexibacter sp.]|nr:hypothetical protein [Conexibacter sp.]
MSRPSVALLVWAAMLALIAVVGWVLFPIGGPAGWLIVALPAFAIGTTVALALAATRPSHGVARAARWRSLPSALLGIALATILLGVAIGQWLWLIGLGLLALALAGLVGERRA